MLNLILSSVAPAAGNICRSPIAESVFRDMLQKKGVLDQWTIDSAATGPWHVGKRPDRRAIGVLDAQGLDSSHRARVVRFNPTI
jgi:protein-tyrosine-phosphatase